MLEAAAEIIRDQARMLEMNGITTSAGAVEQKRDELLEEIEREGWC
jgi:hypothetical protein